MKRVEITVNSDGTIHMSGEDFTGAECDKFITKLLDGIKIIQIKKKPEYFRATTTNKNSISR